MASQVVIERKQRLLTPPSEHKWWVSHAQLPTTLVMQDGRLRVFFSGRDSHNRSHMIYADFNPDGEFRLLRIMDRPLLELGAAGAFDHHGTLPCSVTYVDGRVYLYYIGVSLMKDVPAGVALGLAVSDDDGESFSRAVPGPILSTGIYDPIGVTAGCVLNTDTYRMWYVSISSWDEVDGRLDPRYHIREAYSRDGIGWIPEDRVVIALGDESEGGVGRPSVIRQGNRFHMFFCRRGPRDFRRPSPHAYKFGYACSDDGRVWRRKDDALILAIPPNDDDWDSWMQAYPNIVRFHDELLMFYNGNGFGQTGFGFARLRLVDA